MNIYDYVLEKLAGNKRITDSLILVFKNSKRILDLDNDEIAKILTKTKIHEDSIRTFLEKKEKFRKDPKSYVSSCNMEIDKIRKNFKADIISFSDPEYPTQLKKIKEIPLNLYVRGNIHFDYQRSVAIVGTRKVTNYAKEKIRGITKDLIKKEICILSGLAIGTDTEAHKSAILNGGKTIAVLPYINEIYPSENISLANEILNSGGAIISENCFFDKYYHPSLLTQRNRIISGLSKGIFIVEGSKKSGSFSQYNHAKRQKKIIFSLKPIEKHEGDYLPRLIWGEQKNWISSGEEAIRLLEKNKESQQSISI